MDRNIDITEQRKRAGMTQAEFSVFTGIPVGTLRNWEQGKRKAPPYINTLVYEALRRNTMINIETVSFIAMLNELAEKEQNGIREFKEATSENKDDCIFYDATSCSRRGEDGALMYRVIGFGFIDEIHHDIVCYCDDESNDFTAFVIDDGEDGAPYLEIRIPAEDKYIQFADGKWFFV